MSISVCINTCSLGPKALEVTGSTTTSPHAWRAYALGNFILPAYIANPDIAEVIVTGEWCEGEGYTYVHSPSKFFSSDDAIAQRQAGFEAASGSILIFQHDDHFLAPDAARSLLAEMPSDILLPARYKRTPRGLVPANSGAPTPFSPGYIGGHCTAYKRHTLEEFSWAHVPAMREWDAAQTILMRGAGFTISWPPEPRVFDVEIGGGA